MTYWTFIASLGGVVVGWLLNEASYLIRGHREDKRVMGRALSQLLEIRHRAFAIRRTRQLLKQQFPIPTEADFLIRQFLEALMPNPQALVARYNETIESVAAADPILAFRLRSESVYPSVLSALRGVAQADKNTATFFSEFESELESLVAPQLNEFLPEIARRHSCRSYFAVRKYLKERKTEPNEVNELIKWLKEKAGIQGGTDQTAGRGGS